MSAQRIDTTPRFTPLESAALRAICSRYPDISEILRLQIALAVVTGRENSGSGFFTEFFVKRETPFLPASTPRVLGGVLADVAELPLPLDFLLFVDRGYAECLEAASSSDMDTHEIDFSTVEFAIPSRHAFSTVEKS